ncbi:MAG: SPFH domain-containing protein [Cellulomonas sp.]|uniref:Membrane protease subunit n=1 Tax=Cellulomonas gelida TaxID=1712 RepID=A0A4Y3KM55_9CELL|nr:MULTISPECIES: SPFH domain-containing protein [Cellulomonas]KMM46563.1 band 7 protein [Cellulomonas sp. A375-1]MCR6648101.1 SPFH domain-containing protein [Cellulomonas sp.]MCR6704032.1 SPFH domain-containing protein [Cellulomonas sp.]GEA84040.1 membrane protease subunit [Cellulomonas gelida]GGL23752.1 membrane protease subunit [Cellulomonas gelida]
MTDTVPPQSSEGGDPAGRPVGHAGARVGVEERSAWTVGSGGAALVLLLSLGLVVASMPLFAAADAGAGALGFVGVLSLLLAVLGFSGLTIVSPGQTKVVQLFGRYLGTVRRTGFVLTVPLTTKRRVSVRVRNFETNELKVNDADGNPINIAAIVVWQVADTAKATFAVEDYADFVRVQSESALRHVAMAHPYDHAEDGEQSLRGATEVVSAEIAAEVAARVVIAGVEVIEARISNLAYAPEIAQAMLQRQQAGAIIAARERIVEGAVSMVEDALSRLERDGVVSLDDERRAAMVSNLLVVLCGDSRATPVVNTGSLYA